MAASMHHNPEEITLSRTLGLVDITMIGVGAMIGAGIFVLTGIGATKEPLFRNLLMGNVAQQVAEQAACPVIVVKQRSSILASVLRETVLPPIRRSPKLPN